MFAHWLLPLLILSSLLSPCAQDSSERQATELIEKLRSKSVDERQVAAKNLTHLGKSVLGVLERAAKDSDREFASRVRLILNDIRAEEARQDFGRIEKALLGAKALKVVAKIAGTYEGDCGQSKYEGTATLLMKDPNRLKWIVAGNGPLNSMTVISDGTTIRTRREGDDQIFEAPCPQAIKSNLTELILVFGPASSTFYMTLIHQLANQKVPFDVLKTLELSGFKDCGQENGANVLKYRVRLKILEQQGIQATFDTSIWYDPKSYRLLKRTYEGKVFRSSLATTETYGEFALEPEIPDDQFRQQ